MTPPKESLQPLPVDKRDISLGAFVTLPKDLPDQFSLPNQPVKNQDSLVQGSDFCTQYACCLASQYQEKTELFPEYTFAYSKKDNPDAWGDNLRGACKAQKNFGAMTIEDAQSSITTIPNDKIRYFSEYPEGLQKFAKVHRKKTYVKLNSFNEIIRTLWKYKDRAVVMGLIWTWPLSEYILKGTESSGFGHAVCAVGFKTLNGQKYLEIQNSYGESAGKNGRHLVSHETVDYFVKKYGAFCFIDMPVEQARVQHDRAVLFQSPWWKQIFIRLTR